jgi:hypothetical protein
MVAHDNASKTRRANGDETEPRRESLAAFPFSEAQVAPYFSTVSRFVNVLADAESGASLISLDLT